MMAHLDPESALSIQQTNMIIDAIFGLPRHDPFAGIAACLNSTEFLIDEIEGLEGDIRSWNSTIEHNRKEIPNLEREILVCQRDPAEAKLKLIELRAKLRTKLATKNGGIA